MLTDFAQTCLKINVNNIQKARDKYFSCTFLVSFSRFSSFRRPFLWSLIDSQRSITLSTSFHDCWRLEKFPPFSDFLSSTKKLCYIFGSIFMIVEKINNFEINDFSRYFSCEKILNLSTNGFWLFLKAENLITNYLIDNTVSCSD